MDGARLHRVASKKVRALLGAFMDAAAPLVSVAVAPLPPEVVYDGGYEIFLDLPSIPALANPTLELPVAEVISRPVVPMNIEPEIEYDDTIDAFIDPPSPHSPRGVATRDLSLRVSVFHL